MTAIDSCPGCGYPKFGPGLCAYCQPVLALDQYSRIPARESAGGGAAAGFADDMAAVPAV